MKRERPLKSVYGIEEQINATSSVEFRSYCSKIYLTAIITGKLKTSQIKRFRVICKLIAGNVESIVLIPMR